MATVKVTTLNLTPLAHGTAPFTVKLDAWKQTFYYHSYEIGNDILFLDGQNLNQFAHDRTGGLLAQQGSASTLVLEFGGAFYKGRPIMLDDQLVFVPGKQGDPIRNALFCVKQYFVEDRPGPDKLITDEIPTNSPRPSKQRTRVHGSPARPLDRPSPGGPGHERPILRPLADGRDPR